MDFLGKLVRIRHLPGIEARVIVTPPDARRLNCKVLVGDGAFAVGDILQILPYELIVIKGKTKKRVAHTAKATV